LSDHRNCGISKLQWLGGEEFMHVGSMQMPRLSPNLAPSPGRSFCGAARRSCIHGMFGPFAARSLAVCIPLPRACPMRERRFISPRSPTPLAIPKDDVMAIERTFSIIKPDATARNLTGAINALIEQAGLRIVAQKRIKMSREQAETFYAVHRERPFFRELVDFMISGPVVVQVLEGENAVAAYRDIMGATDPAKAAAGTIRKLHATSIGENSVHGSDAPETAVSEIAQFFAGNEIVG
jgi:nucleoside-diphosphate kinase